MYNIQDAIAAAAESGPDMTQAQQGGGDFEPPAEGIVRLRFVEYIELGKHADEYKGVAKMPEKVMLGFELSGPRHPARDIEGGGKMPQMIRINMNKSLSEKAGFYKLFTKLNYQKTAKHFAQLLGQDFLGTIVHNVVGEGDNRRTYANLSVKGEGYTIRAPFLDIMNEETGVIDQKRVVVDPPLTALKCFIWDAPVALKDMWDSLFIDGMYEAKTDDKGVVTHPAKSKNWIQSRIREATNFKGSALAELLGAGGEPDLGDEGATKPDRDPLAADIGKGAGADPLANM